MPFAIVAFAAGFSLYGIAAFIVNFVHSEPAHRFGSAPREWGTFALVGLGINAANFALMTYFYLQPGEWRVLHFSKVTFLAIMVIAYVLGIAAAVWSSP
jgi:hypothetical protein